MSEAKYIVCYGTDVVELACNDMTKQEAEELSDQMIKMGKKNVRIRLQDPTHPLFPLNFDAESTDEANERA